MARRYPTRQTKAQHRAAAIVRLRDCADSVRLYGESKYPNLAMAIRQCIGADVEWQHISGYAEMPEDILRIIERRH